MGSAGSRAAASSLASAPGRRFPPRVWLPLRRQMRSVASESSRYVVPDTIRFAQHASRRDEPQAGTGVVGCGKTQRQTSRHAPVPNAAAYFDVAFALGRGAPCKVAFLFFSCCLQGRELLRAAATHVARKSRIERE